MKASSLSEEEKKDVSTAPAAGVTRLSNSRHTFSAVPAVTATTSLWIWTHPPPPAATAHAPQRPTAPACPPSPTHRNPGCHPPATTRSTAPAPPYTGVRPHAHHAQASLRSLPRERVNDRPARDRRHIKLQHHTRRTPIHPLRRRHRRENQIIPTALAGRMRPHRGLPCTPCNPCFPAHNSSLTNPATTRRRQPKPAVLAPAVTERHTLEPPARQLPGPVNNAGPATAPRTIEDAAYGSRRQGPRTIDPLHESNVPEPRRTNRSRCACANTRTGTHPSARHGAPPSPVRYSYRHVVSTSLTTREQSATCARPHILGAHRARPFLTGRASAPRSREDTACGARSIDRPCSHISRNRRRCPASTGNDTRTSPAAITNRAPCRSDDSTTNGTLDDAIPCTGRSHERYNASRSTARNEDSTRSPSRSTARS